MEPYIVTLEHVPDTWMTSICSFLYMNKSSVEIRHNRVVPVQRDRDQYIMQLALDGNYKLRLIQQCRMYLQVATLADIINAEGNQLEEWAYTGPGRASSLIWPQQGKPSRAAWAEWRRFLNSMLSTYGRMTGRYLNAAY